MALWWKKHGTVWDAPELISDKEGDNFIFRIFKAQWTSFRIINRILLDNGRHIPERYYIVGQLQTSHLYNKASCINWNIHRLFLPVRMWYINTLSLEEHYGKLVSLVITFLFDYFSFGYCDEDLWFDHALICCVPLNWFFSLKFKDDKTWYAQ